MTNGKLSPRQKMINMMYLVLLAMLALSVAPEVLDAFEDITERLESSALEAEKNTFSYIGMMKEKIHAEIEKENKKTNAGLLDTLDQISNRSASIIRLLNTHGIEMEKFADFDTEEQTFEKKDEVDKNYDYWMGTDELANERRGNGQSKSLRDSLDSYFTFLNNLYNSQLAADSLARKPILRKDPNDTEDPGLRWEQKTFEGPVIANMATLEAMKIEVYQKEKELLELLSQRLGLKEYPINKVMAISAPASQIVPAGLPFETRLFVGMSSDQIHPEFSSQNGRIRLEDGGNSAMLSVMADGSRIPTGKTEGIQTYMATIKVPKANGEFEILTVRQNFTVRKPVVVIESAAIQNLYRRCGNIVNIDVPALGNEYTPVVTATNASVNQNRNSQKKFIIVPTGRKSVVTVKSRTNGQLIKIDDLPYNVISPPKPTIELFINNRPYTGSGLISKKSQFKVRISPDPEFKRLLPKDARYRIARIKVQLDDRLGPPRDLFTMNTSSQNPMNGIQIRIPNEVRQARAGSKLIFVLEGIQRINFQGRAEDLKMGQLLETISMKLRD